MRNLVPLALVAIALMLAVNFQTNAQVQSASASGQRTQAADEHAAIRRVAELYMTFEQAKLREAFYPTANLYLATEQGQLRTIPFAQFLENAAKGAASGRLTPKMSIDLIDHEGSAAIVKITEHSDDATVTDYLSLIRGGEGWKVVSKTFYVNHKALPASSGPVADAQAPSQNSCSNTAISGFTFMVGDWITSESPVPATGATTGTSRTETVLDGCAIWEHRYVEQNGKEVFDAHVVWGYDSTTKRMLLFYIDDRSHTQLYEGRLENGSWAFYREQPDTDGRTLLLRVKYAQKGSGFTQSVERSSDQGATWTPGSVVSYEPKR
jgi:hypothetical protein